VRDCLCVCYCVCARVWLHLGVFVERVCVCVCVCVCACGVHVCICKFVAACTWGLEGWLDAGMRADVCVVCAATKRFLGSRTMSAGVLEKYLCIVW
jgi:hypothetical protein